MPLLDYFHPPLSLNRPWQGFHSAWATTLAGQLNHGLLPQRCFAVPNVQFGGHVEIDVATLEEGRAADTGSGAVATAVWAPPRPALTVPVDFAGLDVVEILVQSDEQGPRLLAAIELVSPANKDRPAHRQALAIKCASYLQQGVSVVLVDVVTTRPGSLHEELWQLLHLPSAGGWREPNTLYAVAYRASAVEATAGQIEVWPEALSLGGELPTLPLWLSAEFAVPLDLEQAYLTTCETLRIEV